MAPNKKKKKLASSSTRGFATTSAPSKKQTQEAESDSIETTDTLDPQVKRETLPFEAVPAISQTVPEQQQLDLSPDELEEHLEKAELQLLIDKYGGNVKRVISRQISKLQTERRLFRTQASQMRLYHKVSSDTVRFIIEKLTAQENQESGFPAAVSSLRADPSGESEDDILMKVWTLYRLLPELGFLDRHRDDAIRELLRRTEMGAIRKEDGKDSPWGLEFCLEFLARSADADQLPTYDANISQLTKHRAKTEAQDVVVFVSILQTSQDHQCP